MSKEKNIDNLLIDLQKILKRYNAELLGLNDIEQAKGLCYKVLNIEKKNSSASLSTRHLKPNSSSRSIHKQSTQNE